MRANFDASVNFTLLPDNDGQPFHITQGDRGGPTAWGITRATLSRWLHRPASVDDVKALTRAGAAQIYRAWYWQPIPGDALPNGVDLMVFDHGVNCGEQRASEILQETVGLSGDAVDGHIGPVTLSYVAAFGGNLVSALRDQQEAHYRSMADFSLFGHGWLARLNRRAQAATALTKPQLVG